MEIDLKTDSRKVKPGDTFIAIRNVNRDGHDYIPQAIKNGATKVIVEEGNYDVETVVVEDTRAYLKDYLYEHYYPYFKDMKLIGVTGTNGKTTIGYMMYQMMTMLDIPCAYMGTIGFYYCGNFIKMVNTTPDVDVLYDYFIKAKDAGCKVLVMEVSSHALAKDRIHGLEFDEVAFTNLTQDHLDFHKTLENYANAKQLLFKKTRGNKIAVINGDDPHASHFELEGNQNLLISDQKGDVLIQNIEFSHLGTTFTFKYQEKEYQTHIQMVGRYNVYNYLTAMLLIHELGYEIDAILALNTKLKAPKGRMELIVYDTNGIFVDYAHTPDATLNVLESAQEFKKGKIITIIGCGGDRDTTKRPIMGEIACKHSDHVIITDDNPRTEDPQKIINDILKGVSGDYEVINDRHLAIAKGMSLLKENDILMILGKGHEDYQIIGTEKIHFSDQEEVEKYINQVAFSGAEDFFNTYKDKMNEENDIIGHFGLGFYSSFMVSKKVQIDTLSYKENATPVRWVSEDGLEFELTQSDNRETRGTTITLFLADDSKEFLEEYTVRSVIDKYCSFLPVNIYLETIKTEENTEDEVVDVTPINDTKPLWLKAPKDCTDEE